MRWMRRWLGLTHEGAGGGCCNVCGNDGGGGGCDVDGREVTGSTVMGGDVTQELQRLRAIHGTLCSSSARQGTVAAAGNK